MGVYIPTAKLPSNCFDCRYERFANCDVCRGFCEASDYKTTRYADCPLIEVKAPHGDLIDRDKAIDGAKVDGAWSALAYEPPVIKSEVE
jgi:hypothetical protein